ncbi:hypothetical protein NBO_76g0011 [Nosema bombycis CQ1]|uniref:Uncharacterized protein n=1 Tax=Nosema bombycis (strain CQ1 / CVCC 102059) TaxID=578461 RepID=R0KRM9_NOSB1|nr:hypothetical protein NBO_76g0011 [Nosema bombycis CQ1]|eukprot:EOB13406.1 hypothetical protein NBO_76g0011 [Nosema bombycis CQ1]
MGIKLPMNHKTRYTVLILGFLVGVSIFAIVITMYKKNKFSKGDDFAKGGDNSVKIGDIGEGEIKEGSNKESKGKAKLINEKDLSRDSEVSSSNNASSDNSFHFSSEEIKNWDFEKLAKNLKIDDQTTRDKLFEELNKAELEERDDIVEEYEQNNEKNSSDSWAKKGFKAGKRMLIKIYNVLKKIINGASSLNMWVHRKVNELL